MKKIYTLAACLGIVSPLLAQSPIDAYQLSQQDLRGTARFMSMGGAFGALGGDLSSLSQNPAGIGIYRYNELGFTLDLQANSTKSESQGFSTSTDNTRFYLNNIGGVATVRLGNSIVPNINFGFTYNKAASFNRRYRGGIPNLGTSLSNYIAGIANDYNLTEESVRGTDSYDPYNPGYNQPYVPWIAVLGYDSYLIDPEVNKDHTAWYGQFGNGTRGSGKFDVYEKGGIDEYNIVIGGNIDNVLYWGMNFDIVSVDYKIQTDWTESLQDAYVYNPEADRVQQMQSDWRLRDHYRVNGTGFNYQFGVILKPIQELRVGVAFHTPTFYNLTETFYNEQIDYYYPFMDQPDYVRTNGGIPSTNDINLRSPWKVIASVAGVIGSKFIVSLDYEWNNYRGMRYSSPSYDYGYDDWWYDGPEWWWAPALKSTPKGAPSSYEKDPIGFTNDKIREIYRASNTIRVGAEYRITPNFSVRAGYNYTTSPVTSKAKDNLLSIPASGTVASYRLDNQTSYVTAGLGYKFKGFYVDLAYVWKHQTSDFYPFSPDPSNPLSAANSKLTLNSSQVALSMGYKF